MDTTINRDTTINMDTTTVKEAVVEPLEKPKKNLSSLLKQISDYLAVIYPEFFMFGLCANLSHAEVEEIQEESNSLRTRYFLCLKKIWNENSEDKAKEIFLATCKECNFEYGIVHFFKTREDLKDFLPEDYSVEDKQGLSEQYQINVHLLTIAHSYWYREDILQSIVNWLELDEHGIGEYDFAFCDRYNPASACTRSFFNHLRKGTYKFSYQNYWTRLQQAFLGVSQKDFKDLQDLAKKHDFLHFNK